MAAWRGFELDPEGQYHNGTPTWPWKGAPEGLATVRQLRAAGLRPGGQEPAGQLVRGRRLWAWLYRVDLAKPKRTASAAWLESTRNATRARRICATCLEDAGVIIPKRNQGDCDACVDARALRISQAWLARAA